jgi:putative tryptophan/tyrosine transport system substrate-binding protein
MMRREFIALLGGAAASWPLAARAQQPGMRVVRWLNAGSSEGYEDSLIRLRQHLKEAGFVEGKRFAENGYKRSLTRHSGLRFPPTENE